MTPLRGYNSVTVFSAATRLRGIAYSYQQYQLQHASMGRTYGAVYHVVMLVSTGVLVTAVPTELVHYLVPVLCTGTVPVYQVRYISLKNMKNVSCEYDRLNG